MLNQGRDAVARTSSIPVENVRLISPYIGGGFWLQALGQCGRHSSRNRRAPAQPAGEDGAHASADLSTSRRTVRTPFSASGLGTDRDGRILAIGHDVFSGNLWSEQNYEGAALQTRTLYAGENRLTRHRLSCPGHSSRSVNARPGEAVGLLALECAIDELAEKARPGSDRVEVAQRAGGGSGEAHSIFQSSPHFLPAGGSAAVWLGSAKFKAWAVAGRALVCVGMGRGGRHAREHPSMVQGERTARTGWFGRRAQFGDDRHRYGDLHNSDPDRGRDARPGCAGTSSSGTGRHQLSAGVGVGWSPSAAASSGSALFDACNNLRKRGLARLAGMDPDSARFGDGRIEAAGQSRQARRPRPGPGGIDADGEIKPGATSSEFSQQSYGAHFAEVGVDIDTGEVWLRRMLGVFTAGRILNEKTARSPGDRRYDLWHRSSPGRSAHPRPSFRLLRKSRSRRIPRSGPCRRGRCGPRDFPSRTRRRRSNPSEKARASASWVSAARARRSPTQSTTRAACASGTIR